MKIVKRSGNIVDFSRSKLEASLLKSGALPSVVKEVIESIENSLFDGISTKEIYRQAFTLLKKASNAHAARYNLRAALQMLGPAGFFFEKFIARIYIAEGWETKTNLILQGECVSHEVDVVLTRDNSITMAECKFHNSREAVTDVKVPMYVLSRFNDLKLKKHSIFTKSDTLNNCLIVTNNRFSSDAVTFANCRGLQLLSWNYPGKDSIRTKVDTNSLYPVTCLTTLSMSEKEKLLIKEILLAKEVINNSDILRKINLSDNRIKNVIKEASELCNFI